MLFGRIVATARNRTDLDQVAPHGVLHQIKKLYLDTVSVFDPISFNALKQMAPASQLLFGTDYPYWTTDVNINALAAQPLTPAELRAIERDNALALMPQLARH